MLGPDECGYRWDVTGPAKDQLLESVLRPAAAAGNQDKPLRTKPRTLRAFRVNPRIVVSAVCVFDGSGRLLTVRKRGTDKFMHPGGKPEAGETPAEAAARELQEEVGIVLAPDRLDLLGCWLADAANEAATQIEATVFTRSGGLECPAVG